MLKQLWQSLTRATQPKLQDQTEIGQTVDLDHLFASAEFLRTWAWWQAARPNRVIGAITLCALDHHVRTTTIWLDLVDCMSDQQVQEIEIVLADRRRSHGDGCTACHPLATALQAAGIRVTLAGIVLP